MRFRYYFVVQDLAGNVVGDGNVSVYLADSNVPAIVYPTNTSSAGVRTIPQLVSNPDGSVVFWLDSNDYSYGQLFDIVVQKDTFGFRLEDVQIIVWDAVNADRLDGFHASLAPAPNVIKPLDGDGKFYAPVGMGAVFFDPDDFVMSNGVEYFVGSVSITTPSWSPSNAWKIIFRISSAFVCESTGVNNFLNIVKFDSAAIGGAFWFWNANTGNTMGVSDVILIPNIPSGVTQQFDFFVKQGSGNANAIFKQMSVNWYLIPA